MISLRKSSLIFRLKTFSFAVIFIILLVTVQSVIPQSQIEQYRPQREQEMNRPNQFLHQRSMERLDLLSRYYRRTFEQQSIDQFRALQKDIPGGMSRTDASGIPSGLLDGPVDPATYIVGAQDVLTVMVWGEVPYTFTGIINPEGDFVIPSAGIVKVTGMVLIDAKRTIEEIVRKQYVGGEVSVTLDQPRSFTVHVGGSVRRPGPYPASSVMRVDRIVALANVPTEEELQRVQQRYLDDPERPFFYEIKPEEIVNPNPTASLRNISLQRRSGEQVYVDLVRYYATGNTSHNPYVREGDRIIVSQEDLRSNGVSIFGAVNLPGTFEYHPGDNLSTMIEISQGFKHSAIADSIVIIRRDEGDRGYQSIVVDGSKPLPEIENVELRRNDRIFIWERPDPLHSITVQVIGEVTINGAFPITQSSTRLSDVITMAGGFTENASLSEAKIIRGSAVEPGNLFLSNPDFQRLMEMRLSRMNWQEREYYNYEMALRGEFVSVDFKKIFLQGDYNSDIVLQDGDIILIPRTRNQVYVYGQVINPGYLDYKEGLKARDYIEIAGGFSDASKKRGIRIIKAGTYRWVKPNQTIIEPGDAIWVPRITDKDFAYYFIIFRDVLQVSTSIATLYLLFWQLNRD
jgi:polysaccharide biosynthesis/export protein